MNVFDGAPEEAQAYTTLAIHIILKALEDYVADGSDEETEFYRESAEEFFSGNPDESNYCLLLQSLGWDSFSYGVISPDRWLDIIGDGYSSIAEAKPKIGLSTRLIPTGSPLWHAIRERRDRR